MYDYTDYLTKDYSTQSMDQYPSWVREEKYYNCMPLSELQYGNTEKTEKKKFSFSPMHFFRKAKIA